MNLALSTTKQAPLAVSGPGVLGRATQVLRPASAPVAVTLLGLALRLYHLNRQSVGYDEAFSMTLCSMPVAEMLRRLIEDFVHPPLHYFALRYWLDIFGFGVGQARMLSVVFGTLAIPLLYFVAKHLFGRSAALVSALLLAISQLGIMFSQESRPYAMFLFFFLACWLLFIHAQRLRSVRLWCAFVSCSILLIYTHYFGLFALGALMLFAFFYRKQMPIPVAWWIAGAAVTLLCYLPWLTSGIFQAAAHSAKTFSGKNSFWSVNGTTFLTAVNFFNNGKPTGLLDSSPLWTFVIGGLLFTAPAAFALFGVRQQRERQNIALAAILWSLPILGAILAGLMHFQYNVRYVAFCAAPYYVLVGLGISRMRPVILRTLVVVALLGYTANSLRANYSIPYKEDFRAAGAYIVRNHRPGDCGAFFPGLGVPLQWSIEQPNSALFRTLRPDDFKSDLSTCGRVWAVAWSVSGNPWQWAKSRTEQQQLDATHTKIDEKRYFWVHVALYSRNKS